MQTVLSVNNISKSYGSIRALNGISFEVPEGSVFGILGPNGSGKTTLLGVVLDVLKASGGTYAWLGGMDPAAARKQIGSLLETPNFYHYLSPMQNLEIAAAIKGTSTDNRLAVLEQTGLLARKDSPFHTFSLGMKQRLAIAAALLGNPRVLVLDEPTNGLDPEGIAEIRTLIGSLRERGITVIMASHMLDEVEKVCTHVAILKRGELLLQGPVNEVLASEDHLEVQASDMVELLRVLQDLPGVKKATQVNNIVQVLLEPGMDAAHVNKLCAARGVVLSHLVMRKKSLENIFIELTNEKK